MARKRHGGLGRGLDALIPQARPKQPGPQQTGQDTAEKDTLEKDTLGKESLEKDPSDKAFSREDLSGKNPVEIEAAESAGSERGLSDSGSTAAGSGSPSGSDRPGAGSSISSGSLETADGADRSGNAESSDSGIRMLRLSQVDPNRGQPRQNFEDEALEELAESIRQFGVLQPILVQKKGSRYEIIAGERRWRASRKAGLKEIPAIVRDYSDQETLELSLIENIQREDLNPIEEAKAFRRLLDEFGLRQEDLAARVSKSRTAITNAVRLLKLDERVQEMLIEDQISMGHARALLPVEIPEEQFLLAQEVADRHLSVREVEKLIKTRMSGKKKKTGKGRDGSKEKDPALELAYRSIEERLKQSLGTKAAIRSGGDGTGKIEIDFYSHEDLEKIVDLLT